MLDLDIRFYLEDDRMRKSTFFDLRPGDAYCFRSGSPSTSLNVFRIVLWIDDSNQKLKKIFQMTELGRIVEYDYYYDRDAPSLELDLFE